MLDQVIAPSHTHQSIQKRIALKLSIKTSYFYPGRLVYSTDNMYCNCNYVTSL